MCEEILLSSGLVDEAYSRYGLRRTRRGTYLATFRAVAKKYPHKDAHELLADLAATTPGEEAKWFAAAKEAGLYDEALALADAGPCDPRTSPAPVATSPRANPTSPAVPGSSRCAGSRKGTATRSQGLMYGARMPTRCKRPRGATGWQRHENGLRRSSSARVEEVSCSESSQGAQLVSGAAAACTVPAMRTRAFVHVAGPAKAGRRPWSRRCCSAATPSSSPRAAGATTRSHIHGRAPPRTHPSFGRYRQAGASGAALFRFPGDGSEHDAFFMTELMTDYSEGVVVEGDSPLEFVDLRVFVAPTPANGDELFVQRSPTPDDRTNTAVLEQVLSEPDSVINFLAWAGGPVLGEMGRGHEAFGLGVGVTGTDWPVPTRRRPLRRTMKSSLPSTKTGGPACSSDAANCAGRTGQEIRPA